MDVHYSSLRDDWETPQSLFDRLHAQCEFTLDVCATDANAKLPKYFTKSDDGLSKSWQGHTFWMNPPYGRGISDWVKKALLESIEGGCRGVALIHARTDTRWFHDWVYNRVRLEFIRGRLRFELGGNPIRDSRGNAMSAPFPSLLCYYGL